jgi:tetratricopeptide (TPR) repeat protein
MFKDHPSGKDLESFLKGASGPSPRASNAQVMRHLLSECPICRERLRVMGWDGRRIARLLEPVEVDAPPAADRFDYSRAFAKAEQAVSALLTPERSETETADEVLACLEGLTEDEQVRQVSSGGVFASPMVVRALIDRSQDLRFRDAEAMLHLASLSRLAAEACTAETAGNEPRLADLKARGWAQYGNALRISGRPLEAEKAFSASERHREAGTGDPVLRAWLLEKTTSLAIFKSSFDEAVEMSGEAGDIYQELGEAHLLGSTLVQKAIAELYSGATESAVRLLNQAIPLIDCEEDPNLLLAACHNLIRGYIDLDRPDQALMLYTEIRELYQESDDPLILLRAAWQEGQILRDLGHLRAAETALLRARKGYVERKLVYEAALVSLELATVYVKLGLVEEVKRTVTATIPIFHSLRVKLEVLASLLQLRQIADQEQQALELIRVLSAQIEPLPKNRTIE